MVDWTAWFGLSAAAVVPNDTVPFTAFISRADHALGHEAQLSSYVGYLRLKQAALRLKLDPIVDRVEAGQFQAPRAHDAFSYVYHESLSKALLADRPTLDAFSGMTHETTRQRFAALDKEVIWICGDCHVGNLGPIADAQGKVDAQIRDLDQTVIGNPAHDLIRLGLSLASAARGSDLPGVTTARMTGRAHARQMDQGTRQAWREELQRNRSKTLDAPSWLWSSVLRACLLSGLSS